ncbi:MAG: type II secretion system F family protein [Candidatus Sericytochromatia bacterium]|nr:type II secretion system F family protein [Candidatus Sericytochromatia bacterium]
MAKPRKPQASRPAAPAVSPGRWSPLMPRQRALFYEQLSRMLKSGLPPSTAVASVLRTPWPPALETLARDLARQVGSGGALSEVLRRHGPLVGGFEAAYIEAAEAAGTLAEGFEALARQHWLRHEHLTAATGKLIYPVCLLAVAAVLGPLHVAFAGDVAGYVRQAVTPLLTLAAGLAGTAWLVLTPGAAPLRGRLYLLGSRLPFFAGLLRKLALAQLGQLLAQGFRAGLPAATVFSLAAAAMPDPVMALACREVEAGVHHGQTLTEGVARHPQAFPHEFVSVIETGEQAGRLDEALEAACVLWREDAERARNNLTRVATGSLMAVALGMVALLILSIGLGIIGRVHQLIAQ